MRKTKPTTNKTNIKRAALDAKKLESVQGGTYSLNQASYTPPASAYTFTKSNGYYSCG